MLSVKNLKVNYGKIEAIKDVSFEVPDGKIVTLIGANGAGKTTTLRAISGLEKTSGGSILFDGKEISNIEAHRLVPMGICHVPEGRKIFPTLTVRENLELAAWTLKHKKLLKQRMEEVFEIFPRIKERAQILDRYLRTRTLYIMEDELIVGNVNSKLRGSIISGELYNVLLEQELNDPKIGFDIRDVDRHDITPEEKKELNEVIIPYFHGKTMEEKLFSRPEVTARSMRT